MFEVIFWVVVSGVFVVGSVWLFVRAVKDYQGKEDVSRFQEIVRRRLNN